MKEPIKIRLNPETPTHKDVTKIPMPSVYKPEWDITGQTNDDVYVPLDLKKDNENNSQNNSESI
jgi:hypothetical protein